MSDRIEAAAPARQEVLAEQDEAWQRLVHAIDSVPAGRVDEPGACGDWSLRTVVGHIAFWDRFEAKRFANQPDLGDVDWERLNQENAAESAGRGYDELYREMLDSHELFKRSVDRTTTVDLRRLRELSTEHYLDHAAEIEAWLGTLRRPGE